MPLAYGAGREASAKNRKVARMARQSRLRKRVVWFLRHVSQRGSKGWKPPRREGPERRPEIEWPSGCIAGGQSPGKTAKMWHPAESDSQRSLYSNPPEDGRSRGETERGQKLDAGAKKPKAGKGRVAGLVTVSEVAATLRQAVQQKSRPGASGTTFGFISCSMTNAQGGGQGRPRGTSVKCPFLGAMPACCTSGKDVGVTEEILFSQAAIRLQIVFGRESQPPRAGLTGIVIHSEMLQMFLSRSLMTLRLSLFLSLLFLPLPLSLRLSSLRSSSFLALFSSVSARREFLHRRHMSSTESTQISPCVHPLIHPPDMHPSIHPSMHPSIHPSIHPPTHPPTHPYPCIYPSIPGSQPASHVSIRSIRPCIHTCPPTWLQRHLPTLLLTNLPTHPHPHPSTHPHSPP